MTKPIVVLAVSGWLAIAIAGLAACAQADPGVSVEPRVAPSICPPLRATRVSATAGQVEIVPLTTGQVLSTDLRSIMIDNGLVRLRYGGHVMDLQDRAVITENPGAALSHVLAGRHVDDPAVLSTTFDPIKGTGCQASACHNGGTHWHDATWSWYGDGVKYSSAEPPDATRIRVLRVSPDRIDLAYEWDGVRLDTLRGPGACQLGVFPQCGPTGLDWEGIGVYLRDGNTLKSVKAVKLYKVVSLRRCDPGYYASLRSNPSLPWPGQGPRAFRLGYVSSAVVWSCDGSKITRHPAAGQHADLGVTDCIADAPRDVTGHFGWPFLRFMRVQTPTRFQSLQYDPTQLGSPGSLDIYDHVGQDGRSAPWQVFEGALPYVSPDLAAEPSASVLGKVQLAAAVDFFLE